MGQYVVQIKRVDGCIMMLNRKGGWKRWHYDVLDG